MEIFLRLKHWHVFIITFGLFPITFAIVSVVDEMLRDGSIPLGSNLLLRGLLLSQTLCVVIANFWLYTIGKYLHKKRYYNSLALALFRYGIYFSTFFNATRYVIFPAIDFFDGAYNELGLMLSLLCSIYCNFIAARLLNSVEKQRDPSFRETLGDFFAFLFYPLGVWGLQPRINKLYNNDKDVIPDPDAPLDQSIR